MSDHSRRDRARLRNNEELRHIDQRGEATAEQDHEPAVHGNLGPDGEGVDEGDCVEEHERGDGGLVEEELHGVHLELLAVGCDPDGVEGGGEDTAEGEEDTDAGGSLDLLIGRGEGIVVRRHADTQAGGDERVDSVARQRSAVEHKVHERHGGGEQDAGDLVEGDGGEGQGEVGQDDVHGHGDGEGDDILYGDAAGDEHGEAWAREGEERQPGDEEVEGGEGELGEFEGGVGEDGFVGEDLKGRDC